MIDSTLCIFIAEEYRIYQTTVYEYQSKINKNGYSTNFSLYISQEVIVMDIIFTQE